MNIKATLRTDDFGSSGSRRLIRKGLFPAEIYGKGENVHIILNAHDFEISLRSISVGSKLTLTVDNKEYSCIFKDLQENIMTGKLIHADFQIV